MTETLTPAAARKRDRRKLTLWQELEWRRCKRDDRYFIETYVKAESNAATATNGLAPLSFEPPFDYQLDILEQLNVPRGKVVSVKCRQVGATTVVLAHTLWLALFVKPGFKCPIVSIGEREANEAMRRLRVMFDNLPTWMRDRITVNKGNSSEWSFHVAGSPLETIFLSFAATDTPAISFTPDRVLLDEFGAVKPESRAENTFKSMDGAVASVLSSPNTTWAALVVTSTARSGTNKHARLYKGSQKRGDAWNGWQSFFVPLSKLPWKAVREQKQHEKKRLRDGGKPLTHELATEYPETPDEAFLESAGRKWYQLDPDIRVTDVGADPSDPETPRLRGRLTLIDDGKDFTFLTDDPGEADATPGPWRFATLEPDERYDYLVYADPSEGSGGDYTAITVLEVRGRGDMRVVGYFHENTLDRTRVAAEMAAVGHHFAGRFGPAMVTYERQGGWHGVFEHVLTRELRYPRLFKKVSDGTARARQTYKYGQPMTPKDRHRALGILEGLLQVGGDGRSGVWPIYPLLFTELNTFVKHDTGTSPRAATDNDSDDCVMSLAGAVAVAEEAIVPRLSRGGTDVSTSEGSVVPDLPSGTQFVTFPSVEDDPEFKRARRAQQRRERQWQRNLRRILR